MYPILFIFCHSELKSILALSSCCICDDQAEALNVNEHRYVYIWLMLIMYTVDDYTLIAPAAEDTLDTSMQPTPDVGLPAGPNVFFFLRFVKQRGKRWSASDSKIPEDQASQFSHREQERLEPKCNKRLWGFSTAATVWRRSANGGEGDGLSPSRFVLSWKVIFENAPKVAANMPFCTVRSLSVFFMARGYDDAMGRDRIQLQYNHQIHSTLTNTADCRWLFTATISFQRFLPYGIVRASTNNCCHLYSKSEECQISSVWTMSGSNMCYCQKS